VTLTDFEIKRNVSNGVQLKLSCVTKEWNAEVLVGLGGVREVKEEVMDEVKDKVKEEVKEEVKGEVKEEVKEEVGEEVEKK
jgi:hypothetical protein